MATEQTNLIELLNSARKCAIMYVRIILSDSENM